MRKLVPLLLLVLLAAGSRGGSGRGEAPGKPSAVSASEDLWQKAVSIHGRNHEWYPERISVISEVLNRRNEPYSVTRLFFSLRMGTDGRLRTELTRALKNGRDTTDKMRSKVSISRPGDAADPDSENTYFVSISDSPFNPGRQGAVSFSASGERRLLFGHACRRFEFTYLTTIINKGETQKLTWSGLAWLEEGSGLPVKLEFSLAPLPRRIRSLWAIYLYDTSRPDKWVLNRVTISGQAGFLFIKKSFRTTTTFSNYRRPPAKEATK